MYVASRLISHASPSWQTWCTRELAHAVPGGRHTRAHARAETWRWPPGRSQQTKALSGTGPHRKELQRLRHWAAQERAAAGTALGRTGKSCSGYVHSSTTVRAILTTVPVPGQAREALSSRKSTGSPRVALPATTLPPVRYNPPAGSRRVARARPPVGGGAAVVDGVGAVNVSARSSGACTQPRPTTPSTARVYRGRPVAHKAHRARRRRSA